MSWTYSGDPSDSELDEVRFLIQDTDSGMQLLQDEEIEYLLNTWMPRYDSVTYVASVAAAEISRKFVGLVSVQTDGVAVNVSDLSARYENMAARLRSEYNAAQIGGELNIDNVLIGMGKDPSVRPLRFGVGLHDNPEAGNQDYGGWHYDPFTGVATGEQVP